MRPAASSFSHRRRARVLYAYALLFAHISACSASAEDNSFLFRGAELKDAESIAKRARMSQILPKWRRLREACVAVEEGAQSPIYLSIVLATRNKDTSGQHLRLSFFLKVISERAAVVHDIIELVIVDYNPDPSTPPLHAHPGVRWPSPSLLPPVRIISVPPDVHESVNSKYPFHAEYWEYEAKNAGIRRACGEYVMVTNPDIILGGPFWGSLVAGRMLRPDAYYRMPRCDASEALPEEALDWPADRIYEHITSRPVARCWTRDVRAEGLAGPEAQAFWAEWLGRPLWGRPEGEPWAEDRGAAGDFLLAGRRAWHDLRGHPELPLQAELDNAMVVQFATSGLRLVALDAPFVAFHMYHTKGYMKQGTARVLYNDLVSEAVDLFGQMDRLRWSYGAPGHTNNGSQPGLSPRNSARWGLYNRDLPCAYM
eukprot:tig00000857_g4944.t1